MKKPYHRTPSESTKAPLMAKTQAKHIPDGKNEGIRILGFTEHEVELVLMSVQCMKRSKRFAVGWEVGMKNFADPTDTGISDARARWKDLSSRLMKLPRLPRKGTSSEQRHESEEMIKGCIIVKDEAGDLSSADDSDGRKAKRRVKTHRKGKRVAKPFVLDSLGYRPEVEDIIGATNKFEVKRSGNEATEPFNTEGRTKKAWADTGDGHDRGEVD